MDRDCVKTVAQLLVHQHGNCVGSFNFHGDHDIGQKMGAADLMLAECLHTHRA